MSDPIVVIGMPRSGTTLLAEILEQLGVFMGVFQDINAEAVMFQRINERLLHSVGAQWYAPEPLAKALEDPSDRAKLSSEAAQQVHDAHPVSYLGWRRRRRFGTIERETGIWGWKDPRSTWTLPLWRELFPELRAVHVIRHGVDVAASLRGIFAGPGTQPSGLRARVPLTRFRWRGRRILLPVRHRWTQGTARLDSLEGSLALWARYVTQGRAQVGDLGDRAIELRFEDLARDPAAAIGSLIRLCGTEPSPRQRARATGLVDPGRSAAYERDPELREFAQRHSELLARYGY